MQTFHFVGNFTNANQFLFSTFFSAASREKSFNRQQIFEGGENSHKKALQTFTLEHSRRDIC